MIVSKAFLVFGVVTAASAIRYERMDDGGLRMPLVEVSSVDNGAEYGLEFSSVDSVERDESGTVIALVNGKFRVMGPTGVELEKEFIVKIVPRGERDFSLTLSMLGDFEEGDPELSLPGRREHLLASKIIPGSVATMFLQRDLKHGVAQMLRQGIGKLLAKGSLQSLLRLVR